MARTSLVTTALCLLASVAHAELGEPCPDGRCSDGEICFPNDDGGYCTIRCENADCPDGYDCRNAEGVASLCIAHVEGPPGGSLGDVCGEGLACERPLVCVGDGDSRYCTRPCAGPGTCPIGYRCGAGPQPLCVVLRGLPGYGEPCADDFVCAQPLICTTHPARSLPFCTTACDGTVVCGLQWGCEDTPEGTRRCVPPVAPKPGLGERCVADGPDSNLVGCQEGLYCLEGSANPYCTGPCSIGNPCPPGFGCREVADLMGECRVGVPNDDIFAPFDPPDIATPASARDAGAPGPNPGPASSDAAPMPMSPPSLDGGAGSADDEKDDDGGGCGIGRSTRPPWWLAAFALGVGVAVRRRWRGTGTP